MSLLLNQTSARARVSSLIIILDGKRKSKLNKDQVNDKNGNPIMKIDAKLKRREDKYDSMDQNSDPDSN